MAIKVMLADDQHLVREGICSLLSLTDVIDVVGQVNDGTEVIWGIERFHPEVLLLDIRMPGLSGIETLYALKEQGIAIPAILLTTFDDHELVLQGMKAGARGFLLKDVTLVNLVKAIETVYEGNTYIQPVVTERILKGLGDIEHEVYSYPEQEQLTGKELEILRLMAGGYSNREIATSIYKSEGTVKNQVSSILGKLGVRDRTRAVLRAIDLGLLG
ncbi:MAG: response regulator transcription factor [Pseudomonadales bacterium]|nr:response regulator transcription factor [Pseudomonadales bacterium]